VSEENVERRLTTILAADVVGFSRLMAADEVGTLSRLKVHRKELIEPKTSEYHGRVVKLMGDGILMEFASVVDAVNFAADVQQNMLARNAEIPDERRIVYRIGINIGDIIVEGDDIYGDGVNLAARLERLAEPGGICLSQEVYYQVDNKVPLTFQALGEHVVKNIERPVTILKVQIPGLDQGTALPLPALDRSRSATVAKSKLDQSLTLFDRATIVVLPFDNLSRDPVQEYFCDGLTHDITTDLSKFANLMVIAAHSAFTYKGRHVRPQVLHQKLGARYVLEGSVQRSVGRVRVNAQLIDAELGHHLWAQRFDRGFDDLFELQDDIIQMIVAALALKVGEVERQRAVRQPPQDMNAYDALLKGSHVYSNESEEGLDQANYWFGRAVEIDPTFARAWGELSYVLVQYVIGGWRAPDTLDNAGHLARKSVRLDDSDYYNHWNLGFYYLHARRFAQCDLAFKEALALNNNDAELLVEMAEALICMGEIEQGMDQIRRAMHINPHSPDWYYWTLALGHYCARAYDEAVQALNLMVDLPKWSFLLRAVTYAQCGDEAESAKAMRRFLKHMPTWTITKELNAIHFKHQEDVEHWLEGLRKANLPE
jgi:TolB-like protein/class 3 adenylate cyclase